MSITISVPLPAAKRGSSYSQSLSAFGGPGITFSSRQDQGQNGLPTGLTINSSGTISGTCSNSNVAGMYNCSIIAQDSTEQSTIVVNILVG